MCSFSSSQEIPVGFSESWAKWACCSIAEGACFSCFSWAGAGEPDAWAGLAGFSFPLGSQFIPRVSFSLGSHPRPHFNNRQSRRSSAMSGTTADKGQERAEATSAAPTATWHLACHAPLKPSQKFCSSEQPQPRHLPINFPSLHAAWSRWAVGQCWRDLYVHTPFASPTSVI